MGLLVSLLGRPSPSGVLLARVESEAGIVGLCCTGFLPPDPSGTWCSISVGLIALSASLEGSTKAGSAYWASSTGWFDLGSGGGIGGKSQGSGEEVHSLLWVAPLMFGRLFGSRVTGARLTFSGHSLYVLSLHSFWMDDCPCRSIL